MQGAQDGSGRTDSRRPGRRRLSPASDVSWPTAAADAARIRPQRRRAHGHLGDGPDVGTGTICAPDPSKYDVPGNNCDDDNDGKIDNLTTCDDGVAGSTAEEFARAIGICTNASEKGYGLVAAVYTQGYGRSDPPMEQQHGVLSKFGAVVKPREGTRLGVLSSGYAREYDGLGTEPFGGAVANGLTLLLNGVDWHGAANGNVGNGSAPPGFPKTTSGCKQNKDVNDVIDLKLQLKAPPNATGFKFDFNFYSGEWPVYICSTSNDGFIAYLNAQGFNGGKPGNVSVDKNNNPISVNAQFFDRCTPNAPVACAESDAGQTAQCAGTAAELGGTGFGVDGAWCNVPFFHSPSPVHSTNGGATGWLTSQASITPGETFTLEFMIWDAGDGSLDSSVLLDSFTWISGEVTTATDRPK